MVEQQDMFDPPHVAYLKEAKAIELSILPMQTKAMVLKKRAFELCPHEKTTTTSNYFPGGYLDVDSTDYITKCGFCGKVIKTWKVQGNSYG